MKTLGFSGGDTGWHPVCKKTFWFSAVPCVCFIYHLVWENVPSLYLDKGAPFWGGFWEKLCKCASFFSRVMPYAPVNIRSATLRCTAAVQKDLSLSYRNMRGEKTTRFFGFSQNLFRRPIFVRPARKIVAYTGNGRRTHNRKAARLIPDRDKQAADD